MRSSSQAGLRSYGGGDVRELIGISGFFIAVPVLVVWVKIRFLGY